MDFFIIYFFLTFTDKYKTMITEKIVEEDEEAFLKESCFNIPGVKES